jgi:hypothetical protein
LYNVAGDVVRPQKRGYVTFPGSRKGVAATTYFVAIHAGSGWASSYRQMASVGLMDEFPRNPKRLVESVDENARCNVRRGVGRREGN